MRRFFLFLLVVVLALSTGAVAQDASSATQTGSDTVVAVVNGEQITQGTLSSAVNLNQILQVVFSQLPQNFGQVLLSTPEGTAFLDRYQKAVLDQLVDSRLLVQLAKAHDIKVDESQVDSQVQSKIQQIMQQNSLTEDQMDSILKQQGSSLDEYKAKLATNAREQLMVQGLHDEIVASATVSDKDIQTYYDAHKSDYKDSDGNIQPPGQGDGPDQEHAPFAGTVRSVEHVVQQAEVGSQDRNLLPNRRNADPQHEFAVEGYDWTREDRAVSKAALAFYSTLLAVGAGLVGFVIGLMIDVSSVTVVSIVLVAGLAALAGAILFLRWRRGRSSA